MKPKSLRKAVKAARISYKNARRKDGVRHIRQTKLCSECDGKNCICRDNQRANELINIFKQ